MVMSGKVILYLETHVKYIENLTHKKILIVVKVGKGVQILFYCETGISQKLIFIPIGHFIVKRSLF